MQRCPACKARVGSATECRRCGCDLRGLIDLETEASRLARCALRNLAAGDKERGYELARAAVNLHRTESSLRVLATAAFCLRRFPEALGLWAQSKNFDP